MSLVLEILIGVILVAGGLIAFLIYRGKKEEKHAGYLQIINAFRVVQMTVREKKNIDLDEIKEFVQEVKEKDFLFKNDKEMLKYIQQYYKNCAELCAKSERLRNTQTESDAAQLFDQKRQLVEWFRAQEEVIREKFHKYLAAR